MISQPSNSIIARDTTVHSALATERVRVDLDHGYVHSAFGCNQFYPSR